MNADIMIRTQSDGLRGDLRESVQYDVRDLADGDFRVQFDFVRAGKRVTRTANLGPLGHNVNRSLFSILGEESDRFPGGVVFLTRFLRQANRGKRAADAPSLLGSDRGTLGTSTEFFGPAHGRAKWIASKNHNRVRANILFADGHVGYFRDVDGDGEFALNDDDFPNVTQRDVDHQVFDGVLTLGRRSRNPDSIE